MRREYAPSGRACLPPMKSFGVRSSAGSEDVLSVPLLRAATESAVFLLFADRRSPTADRLRYSHIPSRPPSRPNPLSRYPPKPAAASKRLVEFTHTTPALIFGAMSSARLMLS